jgi:hypothetical protein
LFEIDNENRYFSAMSRWDSLDYDKEKKERNNNDSRRRNRAGGPAQSSYGTNHPGRHALRSRSAYHSFSSASKVGTKKNVLQQLPLSGVIERENIINSLKSQLFQYQSGGNKYDKSVVIQSIKKLCHGISFSRAATTRDEQSSNANIFMTLLCLLEIKEDNDVVVDDNDDDDDVHSLVAQSIERCLNNCTNDEKNNTSKMNLTRNEVIFGMHTLSSHYNKSEGSYYSLESDVKSSFLISLALLVKNEACQLPPEKTACGVIGDIFIPYLSSSLTHHDQNQQQEQNMPTINSYPRKIACISEAIVALLQHPSHASAMLAPLVQDVSIILDYGMEEQTVNPLRIRLLSVLLQNLETLSKLRRTEEQIYVCRALSASIDAIRKLKKGNETKNNDFNVENQIVKRLQNFVLEVLIKDEAALTVTSLHLLRTLIACYPNDMTGMGWKLIIEGANYPTTPVSSQQSSKHVYGNTVHSREHINSNKNIIRPHLPSMITIDNNDNPLRLHLKNAKAIALVADCLADFILVLPWNIWLKQSHSNQERMRYNTTRSLTMSPSKVNTSGLYKNAVDALEVLIVIATNAFDNCFDRILLSSLARLLKVLLLEIPYCDIKLVRSGGDLWATLFNATFDSYKEKKNISFQILLAAMGGKVTPQGDLRGMCSPGRAWFLNENASSEVFIKRLMDSFGSMDECLDWSIKILSSILRTLPDVALQRWDSFHNLFEGLNTSSTSGMDLIRLEVFESLMLGRSNFTVSAELKHRNDIIIMDLSPIMLKPWSHNGLRRLVTIYAAFRSQDWIQLDTIEGRVLCHFEQMLEYCHDSNAKIREGASKAVGEFCTQYIAPTNLQGGALEETKIRHFTLISDKVCTTMLGLCGDQNATVRSMSIFSLGNLASALKDSNQKDLLDTKRLHEISKAILSSFNDTNDKVVKNAIRSTGHTGNLLACSLLKFPRSDLSSSYAILVQVIKLLTLKLSNTLHVTLKEQTSTLTWKERSAAKKHGWGCCHSLGLVFEGLSAGIFKEKCNVLVSACSEAIHYLIQCPKNHANLNEKVVVTSMAAICNLPSDLLTLNDYQKMGYIGEALIASVLILQKSPAIRINCDFSKANNTRRTVSSKMSAQNQQFLRHLLDSASITDASKVLNDEQITTQTIGMLYSWMVEQPLHARAFEIFAIALQRPGKWSKNVSFEQQFASRALQKYKQARNLNVLNSLPPSENSSAVLEVDDEADEL